ncbi:MAG TPA: M1 family metallopeptidase [Chitinophagaceae bacterium]|nr:M1 family metallopeptidase [Chitinophagaceae bacterium]
MPKYIVRSFPVLYFLFFMLNFSCAQPLNKKGNFTLQDTLRGSITPERAWWNVVSYNISVAPDYKSKTIAASNQISFDVNSDGTGKKMQIDLQKPLGIDSIIFHGKKINSFTRNGNVFIIDFGDYKFLSAKTSLSRKIPVTLYKLWIYYHGKPREAIYPPWDGGWIFSKDEKGRPWMTVACQGLGASVWYPCKDHQSDEPDQGATIQIKIPDTLVAVANGRLIAEEKQANGYVVYTWQVKDPINNYNIVPYIGKYVHFSDNYIGETEKNLSLDYWVLDYNLDKAKIQFGRDVKRMMKAFEYWFGPYPFYDDGYKLVESSHLGMEHQSAIAYGNHYKDGYLGSDLSGSGWGMKWDYIIVHESGHEWFGNNITTNDIADMWVHEGFTMYSEVLFTEYFYGKEAADEYVQGIRRNINNIKPVIGPYGVNHEGSGDMYNKGANMLHTIRHVIDDDSLFRDILRGMNKEFYHHTTTSKEVEAYFSKVAGKDLSKIFDQYLRNTQIPVLEYKITGDGLSYRWTNCVAGFDMPVKLKHSGEWLLASDDWKNVSVTAELKNKGILADENFYIKVKNVE